MEKYTAHHAYAFEADSLHSSSLPEQFCVQSTDVTHLLTENFGIDEARQLTEQSATKALEGSERIFVIFATGMTVQAQNALLKLFEEPPLGARFFLIMPQLSLLIPTLRSRLSLVTSKKDEVTQGLAELLKLPLSEQMQMVTDRSKEKDLLWMREVARGGAELARSRHDETSLASAEFVLRYLDSPGSSKKMLLEELLLSLQG